MCSRLRQAARAAQSAICSTDPVRGALLQGDIWAHLRNSHLVVRLDRFLLAHVRTHLLGACDKHEELDLPARHDLVDLAEVTQHASNAIEAMAARTRCRGLTLLWRGLVVGA